MKEGARIVRQPKYVSQTLFVRYAHDWVLSFAHAHRPYLFGRLEIAHAAVTIGCSS